MMKFYNILRVVFALLAVGSLSLIIMASAQFNRDLEQMIIDVQELEEISIQMNEEQKALLEELEEIHPPEQEPNLRIPPL